MSPYSYLAATQVLGLAERTGASVRWRPLYLPGVMKATGNSGPTAVAAKAIYSFKDCNDWAKHYGLPELRIPDDFPFIAVLADRCAVDAEGQGKLIPYVLAMFKKIWADGADCNDQAIVRAVLAQVGLDPEATIARAGTEEIKAVLRKNTDEAVEKGAYGVPTFFVDGEMFVGNDRLMFVEQALTK